MQSCMVGSFWSFHTLGVLDIVTVKRVQLHCTWWLVIVDAKGVTIAFGLVNLNIIMRPHSNTREYSLTESDTTAFFNSKKMNSAVIIKSSFRLGPEKPNCHHNNQFNSFPRNIESINRRCDNEIEYYIHRSFLRTAENEYI